MDKQNKNQRYLDSLASKFVADEAAEVLIAKSPSDVGVRRNKGRNGARYAPLAIEAALKKMNDHLNRASYHSVAVSDQEAEKANYEQAMDKSADRLSALLRVPRERVAHLGGGHDHALPLLKALERQSGKNTLIVNFDAHCDTRVDDISHSGTPFRDFDRAAKKPFHLVQIGIHNYANSPATLSPLTNNTEKIFFRSDVKALEEKGFAESALSQCPFKVDEDTNLFISLDCDALSSSVMSAVSAVNHNGLDPEKVLEWTEVLKGLPCRNKVLGVYEYNPLFEDLSQKGARYLAGLIYHYLS